MERDNARNEPKLIKVSHAFYPRTRPQPEKMGLEIDNFRYVSKEVVINISRYLSQTDINSLAQTYRSLYDKLNFELYRHNARESKSSALRWAAINDDSATAKLCLLAGATHEIVKVYASDPLLPEVSLEYYEPSSKRRERQLRYEVSPLWVAAAHGSDAVAQILIENGADLDMCSPLSAAVCCGHKDVVRLLLLHKVNLEDEFEWKGTALEIAV